MAVAATMVLGLGVGAGTASARVEVVGGETAPSGSWPSLAALVATGLSPFDGQFCGGTLIDPEFVVTAAHCIVDPSNVVVNPASFDVALGVTTLPQTVTPGAGTWQRIGVDAITPHPGFDIRVSFQNDVALLHLASPATIQPAATFPVIQSDLVGPLDSARWSTGQDGEVAGWGNTLSPPQQLFVDVLKQATVPIQSDAFCSGATSYGAAFVPAAMLCAGPLAGGVDTCQGDSGGPFMVRNAAAVRVLAGVTSFGQGCAQANFPGVYTQLDTYRAFVYGTIGVTAPSAPALNPPNPSGSQATITWGAPAANGRPILAYRVVTTGPGAQTVTQDLPATTLTGTATGLVCGVDYQFAVRAVNVAGLGPAAQSAAFQLPPVTPAGIGAPTISGQAGVGQLLTGSQGQWANCPQSFAMQWQREVAPGAGTFADIPAASGSQYTVLQSDAGLRIRLQVTASNAAPGSAVAFSAPTSAVPSAPASIQPPAVSGRGRAGSPMVATPGTWTVPGAPSFAWRRETAPGSGVYAPIPGAAGATYVPRAGDVGHHIVAAATLVNASGTATALSPAVRIRPAFTLTRTGVVVVRTNAAGVATITAKLRGEPGATLRIRVLDHRSRLRAPIRTLSRIDGRRPAVASKIARGPLRSANPHTVSIAIRGARSGTLRNVRLLVHATAADGSVATLTVRARVRL